MDSRLFPGWASCHRLLIWAGNFSAEMLGQSMWGQSDALPILKQVWNLCFSTGMM